MGLFRFRELGVERKVHLSLGGKTKSKMGNLKVERKEMQGMRLFYRLVLMLTLAFSFGGRNCDYPHFGGS
jgi:hypothetical protein